MCLLGWRRAGDRRGPGQKVAAGVAGREPPLRLRPVPAPRARPQGGARVGSGPGAVAGSGKRPPPGPRRERRGEARQGGAGRDGKGRPRRAGCSRRAPSATMGLETEKADVQLFMDDDSYSRHSGVDYADPDKFADLGSDRDPHRLNSNLKVGFEDVIAEPVSTHSFDKVWICSHALFEISKYVIYKFLTLFLAIPLAFAAGILFATLSCLHIWIIMPFVKTCLMVLPSVQTIWKSITDVVIAPLCTSVGRSFSSVSLQLSHD
ncbi:caveolin-2 isoform X1 [Prionailurus viverrinus]|uniref:caveolin-2 isoform X1 n=1 Tax=Prionailurus viverrinus TaxID=61388 RepID=UPI001FF44605|nr:caveolin-2 isoform X1 [Prionailurus viverrinus]